MNVIKNIKKDISLHLMILPAVVILFIYAYVPMLGLVIAFQHYMPVSGFFKSPFVGFTNFKFLFLTPGFTQSIFNTVYIAVLKIIFEQVVPITFALLLNEIGRSWYKRTLQTIVYLPHFISWVLMAGIIIDILSPTSGIINEILKWFGFKPVFFLGSNGWFPIVMVLTDVWKEFGWGTILYLAAITGISPSLYEAAIIDGAGRWKQTLHITLPGIQTTIILLATLSLGNVLNAGFDQIYNLMSPITMQTGDIIDTFVYRLGIQNAQYSIATAAGLFKSVITCALIVVSYRLAFRYSGYKVF
jgi:putative aldouronate transport system permease protein